MPAQELTRRPQASAETVEDLVARVMRGEVRVPRFQRGLKWKSKDVVDLFDSIYRGFPIGALLLRTGDAEAAEIPVGPLRVVGEELPAAWWVVDGQQRLTALAVGLARPLPVPVSPAAQDPWVVFFDPDDHSFHGPRGGDLPSRWIPLPLLLDASRLQEWMMEWAHRDDTAARKAVFEAGKRLREYRVPIYVIDTDDEAVLRSIFHRVNNTGQSLTWPEVHDALYGHRGPEPSSIAELSDRLAEVGAGRPDEDHLVSCLLAYRGQDVTRSLGELLRDKPDLLDGAAAEAMPALREVIGFLRSRAEIPHLRLLPYSTPLVVLTRFFQQHPAPSERSLMLLVRWVWRSLLVANHVSWLDIAAIHAAAPHARFVAKAELRRWPLLGWMSHAAGTLFIERAHKRDALRVVHRLAEALRDGDSVVVFPEGTTGDGRTLLPFHGNLLQAAIATGTPVQPVVLRYSDGAHRFSPAVQYLGATTLLQSAWRVLSARELCVHVQLLAPLGARHADRRALAAHLREQIHARLHGENP